MNLGLWDTRQNKVVYFDVRDGVWDKMREAGYLTNKNDVLALMPSCKETTTYLHERFYIGESLTIYMETKPILLRILHLHTLLTPSKLVVWLNYNRAFERYMHRVHGRGAGDTLNNKPEDRVYCSDVVSKAPFQPFVEGLGNYSLSCVGAGAGVHACANLCRRYGRLAGNKTCDRIMGYGPVRQSFNDTLELAVRGREQYMLTRRDAKYVATFLASIGDVYDHWFTGIGRTGFEVDPVGDETFLVNLRGRGHDVCSGSGGWSGNVCIRDFNSDRYCTNVYIGNLREGDYSGKVPMKENLEDEHAMYDPLTTKAEYECSHTAVIIHFLAGMDTGSAWVTVHWGPGNDLAFSAANSFMQSKDRRFPWLIRTTNPAEWMIKNKALDMAHSQVLLVVCSVDCYVDSQFGEEFVSRWWRGYFVRLYFVYHKFDQHRRWWLYIRGGTPLLARIYRGKSKLVESGKTFSRLYLEARSANCLYYSTYVFTGTKNFECTFENTVRNYVLRDTITAGSTLGSAFNRSEESCKCEQFSPHTKYVELTTQWKDVLQWRWLNVSLADGNLLAVEVNHNNKKCRVVTYWEVCELSRDCSEMVEASADVRNYGMFVRFLQSGTFAVHLYWELQHVKYEVNVLRAARPQQPSTKAIPVASINMTTVASTREPAEDSLTAKWTGETPIIKSGTEEGSGSGMREDDVLRVKRSLLSATEETPATNITTERIWTFIKGCTDCYVVEGADNKKLWDALEMAMWVGVFLLTMGIVSYGIAEILCCLWDILVKCIKKRRELKKSDSMVKLI